MNMLAHFQSMLGYESWANERAIASLESVPVERAHGESWDRARGLVMHNLLARRVWLWRIEGTAYDNPKDWFAPMSPAQLRAFALEVDHAWRVFLDQATQTELDRVVRYRSSEGQGYTSSVANICTHVFNHSTYHRGQIARIVHELGGKRAATDHIGFSRKQSE
jgi:uncharacterized damage-inducible protein DinB